MAATSKMKDLLKDHTITMPAIGDNIKGTVAAISDKGVHIDIDGVSTGIVRGRELYDQSGEYSNIKTGDEIEATVVDLENENGEIELSFRYTGHQKAWSRLATLQKDEEIVKVKIINANTGGLMAELGKMTGFIPVSQLSPEHYPRVDGGDRQKILEKLQKLIGHHIPVKVLNADEEEDKLIFSEKAAWEEQQESRLSKIKIGDTVEGKVTGIVDFGVFVEFEEGLEGLIHISELAWQRIDHPSQVMKVGEMVKAEIIEIDGSKISLSRKRLLKDPWANVNEKYNVGDIVKGTVLKANPFGLFVELDPDIHGLAHVSELSNKKVDPLTFAKQGDTVEFKVISIEPQKHRLGLSIKALSEPTEEVSTPEPQPKKETAPKTEDEPAQEEAVEDKSE